MKRNLVGILVWISIMASTLLFSLFVYIQAVSGATVQLGWDPNSEPDLVGYRVYQSNTGIKPFKNISTLHKQTTVTFGNISTGRPYYWAVTARNATMESEYSNIVYLNMPRVPTGLFMILNGLTIRP